VLNEYELSQLKEEDCTKKNK